MAEQEPVEKENIVELHAIEHDKIPAKEAEKSKAVSDPVPRGKNGCGQKQQDRDPLYDPADDVRPAEPLFFVRDRVQNLLRCGGKEPLILNKADAAVQNEKICGHQQNRRKDCHQRSDPVLLNVLFILPQNRPARKKQRAAAAAAPHSWRASTCSVGR